MNAILDGAIQAIGAYDGPGGYTFDVQLTMGGTIYMLDSASGVFSREKDGAAVISKLDKQGLDEVCLWCGIPA